MKRICYYSISTHLGGAERSLLDLLSAWKNQKNMRVLLPSKEGPLLEELKKYSITADIIEMPADFLKISRESPFQSIWHLLKSIPGMFVYILKLRNYFKVNQFDIIHTTGLKCHVLSVFISGGDEKILWHLRDILQPGLTRLLLNFLYFSNSKKIKTIANSKVTAMSLSQKIQTEVIYNGIDEQKFFPKPNTRLHEKLNIPSEIPIVGILGVIARWKGQIEFIHMAKLLVQEGVDAHFVIIGDQVYDTVGDSGLATELRNLVKTKDLTNRVHFLGFQKEAESVLNDLDILVHASIRPEPFGRVIVEAQACGVPVVASGAGGVLEIIQNNVNGIVFSPGNIEEMAEAVKKILGNAEFKNLLVSAASDKIRSDFTMQEHWKKIQAVYERI